MARLFFEDQKIYSAYFDHLKAVLKEYGKENKIKGGIKLYSPDEINNSITQFPCVSFEIFGQQTNSNATDFIDIEYLSRFSVEINIYTSGLKRYENCLNICNMVIRALQEKMELGDYITRGLIVVEKTRTLSLNEDICRFTARLTGVCDNANKIILPR